MWLRARETAGVEFIVSYRKEATWGKGMSEIMQLGGNVDAYTLKIKSFNKLKDSGSYSCATYNANKLNFGKATVLQGVPGGFIFNCVYFF